jgi:hypothetical protein
MAPRFAINRINASGRSLAAIVVAALLAAVAAAVHFSPFEEASSAKRTARGSTMLILRGIANAENPRGQLDDPAAVQYARELGYKGEVLDVAGNTGGDSAQVKMALDRIRGDQTVRALYGFSGGGYNARTIWKQLSADERKRIGKVVIVGSPGVGKGDFPGGADVVIEPDPPEGHMAGPKVLLEETVGQK